VVVWLLLIFRWAANFVIRIGFSALLPSIIDELQALVHEGRLLASAFFYDPRTCVMQNPRVSRDRSGGRDLDPRLPAARSPRCYRPGRLAGHLFLARACRRVSRIALLERGPSCDVTAPDRIGFGQGVSFSGPAPRYRLIRLSVKSSVADRDVLFGLGPIIAPC